MNFAYFCRPHVGGTYSVYLTWAKGLLEHGANLYWITTVRDMGVIRYGLSHDAVGSVVRVSGESEAAFASSVLEVLSSIGAEAVFDNLVGDRFETNILPFLPEKTIRLIVVHTMSPEAYRLHGLYEKYSDATIAVSDRIFDVIKRRAKIPECIHLIRNGVHVPKAIGDRLRPSSKLRVGYVGRLEDSAKGVCLLPEIARCSADIIESLVIAGDGPESPRLVTAFRSVPVEVKFLGEVTAEQALNVIHGIDVLLVPSRYEGTPMVCLEAMSLGAVVVASRIRGSTDVLLEHGRCGVLVDRTASEFARALGILRNDPSLRRAIVQAARERVAVHYNAHLQTQKVFQIVEKCRFNQRKDRKSKAVNEWMYVESLYGRLKQHLPLKLKTNLRAFLECASALCKIK